MSEVAQSLPGVNYDALCKFDVMKSEKFTFVMEIPNFSLRTEKIGEFLFENLAISGPGCKITKWLAIVFPKGVGDYEGILVLLKNISDEDVRVKYFLSVVDYRNGNSIMCLETLGIIKAQNLDKGWALSDHHVINDILKLVFEITVFGESKKTTQVLKSTNNNELLSKNIHQDQLSNDLHLLFNSKEYADVKITCGGKVFECHKNILASRSPVFKTMFDSNMRESFTGNVEINNMAPDVLENLLSYIYTCNAPSIDRLSRELLATADQYQVEKLKAHCEMKLCAEIGIENCVHLLMLGDMHQAFTLKTQALRFLSQNMDKINISECKRALISNPALLFEVMENILPTGSASGDA